MSRAETQKVSSKKILANINLHFTARFPHFICHWQCQPSPLRVMDVFLGYHKPTNLPQCKRRWRSKLWRIRDNLEKKMRRLHQFPELSIADNYGTITGQVLNVTHWLGLNIWTYSCKRFFQNAVKTWKFAKFAILLQIQRQAWQKRKSFRTITEIIFS